MSTPVETRERPRAVGAAAQLHAPQTLAPLTALRTRAVVLAGGLGHSVVAPFAQAFPKQLVDVLGAGSLLQMTVGRLQRLADVQLAIDASPIIVCGAEHRAISAQQMAQMGVGASFIIEPTGRNTAPALSLAAMHALADGGDAVLVVMPADHMIGDVAAFQRAVAVATRHAERGAIVTLGNPGPRVRRRATATLNRAMRSTVRHTRSAASWKTAARSGALLLGIGQALLEQRHFVLRASVWLSTLQQMQPETYAACSAAYDAGQDSASGFTPDEHLFANVPSDSIDYAVMENLTRGGDVEGVVVPLGCLRGPIWGLVGSVWDAPAARTSNGNVSHRARADGRRELPCYVRAESRLVSVCRREPISLSFETADAVLVVDRSPRCRTSRRSSGASRQEQGTEVDGSSQGASAVGLTTIASKTASASRSSASW